jgi:hypothetical protein
LISRLEKPDVGEFSHPSTNPVVFFVVPWDIKGANLVTKNEPQLCKTLIGAKTAWTERVTLSLSGDERLGSGR